MLFEGPGETSRGWDLALNVPGLALSVSGSKSTGDLGEPTATREDLELFKGIPGGCEKSSDP